MRKIIKFVSTETKSKMDNVHKRLIIEFMFILVLIIISLIKLIFKCV